MKVSRYYLLSIGEWSPMMLRVELNGTDTNPYYRLGLCQNPFPQIADAKYAAQCLHLQALGGDPIPDVEYIRKHLKGWKDEFVEICCQRFEKGKLVKFDVEFKP
jgi:hypothetical protein